MKIRIKKEYWFFIVLVALIGVSIGLYAKDFSYRFADFLYIDSSSNLLLERHRIKRDDSLHNEVSTYVHEYFLGSFYHGVLDPVVASDEVKAVIVFDDTVLIDFSSAILKKDISTEEFEHLQQLLVRGLKRTYLIGFTVRFLLEGNEFMSMQTSFVNN